MNHRGGGKAKAEKELASSMEEVKGRWNGKGKDSKESFGPETGRGDLRGATIIISAMGYTTYAGGRAEVGLALGGSPFLLPWFALPLALTTPLTIHGPITEACIASAIGLSGNRVGHRADWHCQRRDLQRNGQLGRRRRVSAILTCKIDRIRCP